MARRRWVAVGFLAILVVCGIFALRMGGSGDKDPLDFLREFRPDVTAFSDRSEGWVLHGSREQVRSALASHLSPTGRWVASGLPGGRRREGTSYGTSHGPFQVLWEDTPADPKVTTFTVVFNSRRPWYTRPLLAIKRRLGL